MALTKIDDRGLKTPIDLLDSEKIRLGTGNDLEIYHDGNTYIDNTNDSCDLRIQSDTIELKASSADEMLLKGVKDGAVELYHNNSKKFQTTSAGCGVTGNLTFADSGKAIFGAGDDLQIYHDGSQNIINGAAGQNLEIQTNAFRVNNQADSETMIVANADASVELYYDNSKKFETTSYGVLMNGDTHYQDNQHIKFGASQDLKIWHDGSHSYIQDAGTGHLRIRGDDIEITDNANNNNMAKFIEGSAVELYYNNTKHFETISNGVKLDSGTDTILEMHTSNGTAHSRINFSNNSGDNYGGLWYSSGNIMEFRTNNAERMRVDSSGTLFIGKTSQSSGTPGVELYDNGPNFMTRDASGGSVLGLNDQNSATGDALKIYYSDVLRGSLVYNGSSFFAYTASDYRLKENDTPISDGITRVKRLRPVRFNWKKDSTKTYDGFIAHEVQEVVPDCVVGEKDAEVDSREEGYQRLAVAGLVPVLTAALKDAITKIETLETKVAALEAA